MSICQTHGCVNRIPDDDETVWLCSDCERAFGILDLRLETQRLRADHDTMLANLTATQARCTELLDEARGWRAHFLGRDPSKDLPVAFGTMMPVLGGIVAERFRQDCKWGRARLRIDIPDGTGSTPLFDAEAYAASAKEACDRAFAEGNGSFLRILAEEFAEVIAEADPKRLRAELVQVAAVAVLWCEVIDLREIALLAKERT